MSINGVSYNPYVYTGAKAALNSSAAAQNKAADNSNRKDEFSLNAEHLASELRTQLGDTRKEQGLIGKVWDGFKNLTHIGAGSNKAEKAIEKFEKGEISKEEVLKAVEGYKKGQKQCVDVAADIVSGITAFAAFSLVTGLGLAAVPFTGGASLGLVAAGLGATAATGAITKVAIKGIDSAIGGRKYKGKDALYDIFTGSINGMFAPITAGIGGAVGKAIGTKIGVTVARNGGQIVLKEGLKGTAKGAIAKTLLTTNVAYTGGTTLARGVALTADMAANGAVSGAVDSSVRYLAGDEENKSLQGFVSEVKQGTIGGLIAAPVIGGGMKLAGKGIGKVTNKIADKIDTNYTKAKTASMNTPVVESPDKEVAQGLAGVVEGAKNMVDNIHTQGSDFLETASANLVDISNGVDALAKSANTFNADVSQFSAEQRAIVTEILGDLASGADVDSRVAELAQKAISITDMLNARIGTFSADVEEKISQLVSLNENLTNKATGAIDFAGEVADSTVKLAENAAVHVEKIPETEFYKQLGSLPEKVKGMYTGLQTDAANLEEMGKMARAKLMAGKVKEGLLDLNRYYDELDMFNARVEQQMSQVQSSAQRSGIDETARIMKERFDRRAQSDSFKALQAEEKVRAVIEDTNIGFSKMIQTFSTDKSLPSNVREFFGKFKSNAIASRDMPQAQALVNELYGNGRYTLIGDKAIGVASIGEVYLAKGADGKEVVIKMLKEGITPEKFAADRKAFTNYITEFVTDAAEKDYKLKLVNGMFDAWDKELNFGLEAQGAKEMAIGAKRFNVAQTLEVGTTKGGQNISLVMEKAPGIKMETLVEMADVKRENPKDFLTSPKVKKSDGTPVDNPWLKNADFVEKNPLLASSDAWMEDFGRAFQKAQNEQMMFVSKTGSKTVHADPHSGNIFVDFDAAGKAKITYIDTGNVVRRTNSEVIKDLGLSLNTMMGNSRGIAESMLDGATLPKGANKAKLVEKMAQMLDERLFKASVNLKDTTYTQNAVNGILKELGVIPNVENSNLIKATLQRVQTSREISGATGVLSSKSVDIQDLSSAILQSLKMNRKETLAVLKPAIQWARKNNDQAMSTFFQMLIKNPQAQTA